MRRSAQPERTAAAPTLLLLLLVTAGCGGVAVQPSGDATAPSGSEPVVVPFEPVLHCSEDDVLACIMLGRQDIEDTDGTWLRRLQAEVDPVYFARLEDCGAGDDDACYDAGWLGIEGLTTVDVEGLAQRLLRQTCERGHNRACATVVAGSEVPERAAWAEQQCLQGDTLACVRLSDFEYWRWYDAGREGVIDIRWAAAACEQGFGPMCSELGANYRWPTGDEPPDLERALESYRRGCELGDAYGCRRTGMTFDELAPDDERPPERVYYDRLACRMGDGDACSDAGKGLERGHSVPVDLPLARAHYEAGCDLGSWRACNNLALAIVAGRGGPVDHDAAFDAWDRACAQGHQRACSNSGWHRFKLDGGDSSAAQVDFQADICAVDGTSLACHRLRALISATATAPEQFERVRAALQASCLRDSSPSCASGFGLVRDHVAAAEFIVAASPFADVIRRPNSATVRALFLKLERAWLDETDPARQVESLLELMGDCTESGDRDAVSCQLILDLPHAAMCTGRLLPDDPLRRETLMRSVCMIYSGTPPCSDDLMTFTCP